MIKAEQICLQLMVYPDTPEEVKAILTGRNEAMMTPNVERPDPFLMAHSRHVNLLEELSLGKSNSPVQTSFSSEVSTQVLDTDQEGASDGNQIEELNDLDSPSTSPQRAGDTNENRINDSDDEIVVLSEEAQNIF